MGNNPIPVIPRPRTAYEQREWRIERLKQDYVRGWKTLEQFEAEVSELVDEIGSKPIG